MGMCDDDHPGHEGFLVGLVRDDGRWRVLAGDDHRIRPIAIQVACECGWRSPRMYAPLGAEWSPHILTIRGDDEGFGDRVTWPLWRAHLEASPPLTVRELGRVDGCYATSDLVEFGGARRLDAALRSSDTPPHLKDAL